MCLKHNYMRSPNEKEITYQEQEDGCWLITSHKPMPNGYYNIKREGKTYSLGRYIYEQNNGPIPDGLVIMHLCDNPACVNPTHLKAGTQRENIQDMVIKNRNWKGIQKPSCKLTEEQVIEIRHLLKTHTDKEVAKMYNIHKSTTYSIRRGEKWKHIGQDIVIPNKCKKLKEADKNLIKSLIKEGKSLRGISKITKFNRATITKIKNHDI